MCRRSARTLAARRLRAKPMCSQARAIDRSCGATCGAPSAAVGGGQYDARIHCNSIGPSRQAARGNGGECRPRHSPIRAPPERREYANGGCPQGRQLVRNSTPCRPPDQRPQEHAVEAQLAGSRHLLEQRRAHLDHRDFARGADGGVALGPLHVAGLAETFTGREHAHRSAVALHRAVAAHQNVETIVHLAFLDDLLAAGVVLPVAGAHHLDDLGVRELVEEFQAAQQSELLLLVHAGILLPQLLVHAGELGGQVQAALLAAQRVLLHGGGHHHFQFLGHVIAQGVDRRRRGVDDLVQELGEVAGTERAVAGQQFVHHGAERIQVRGIGQLEALHLLGRHVAGAAGDAFDARDVRVGHQCDAKIDDAHVAVLREHDVRGLDVAVDHAARVRVVQRLGALEHELDHVIDAQQVVGAAVGRQRARAVHVLGDDIAVAVLFAGVVDRQDVRVVQHAHHVRFGQEHLAGDAGALVVAGDIHRVDLDRHVAPVVRVVREIHGAGAAAPDLVDDEVLADALGYGPDFGTGSC